MKKITEFGCSLYAGCKPAIIALLLLVCIADFTNATAQTRFTTLENGHSSGKTVRVAEKKNSHVTLYPELVSDYLLVLLPVAAATNVTVTMRDMDGNTVATDSIAAGGTNTVIDVKKVPSGTYSITIEDAIEKQVLRLAKY